MIGIVVLSAVLAGFPALAAAPAKKAAQVENPLASRITGAADYIPFFGVRASISDGIHIAGVLAVDAGLQVPDTTTRKKVQARKARVSDAMRAALADYAYRSHVDGEVPDARLIKVRLQRAVDRVIGAGSATVSLASLIIFDD